MGKQRNNPSKKRLEVPEQPLVSEDIGVGEGELVEENDFDHFLETIDDSSDSEDETDESDQAVDDDAETDSSDNGDDDEEMEPEEDQEDLNEDEEEVEEEENESDEQESSDDQATEEGEEGAPLQNGMVGGEGSASESENEQEGGDGGKRLSVKNHKMDLHKLQDTDPEFFAYLKQNDSELLDFNDSEDDEDSGSEEEALHKPPETLEEASDSEAEEERLDETSDDHKSKVQKFLKKGVVDINVIAHWETQLSESRDITVLTNVIEALQCAVHTLSQAEAEASGMKWRVDGSANFNALIRLCIKQIKGFCVRFLCGNNNAALSETKFDQKPFDVRDKSKQKWTRLRPKIKTYMEIIVELFKCMGNPDAIAPVLRHTLKMSGFWAIQGVKSFKLLRSLVNIWSQGEDSCRVIAFLTIIRMTNYNKDTFLVHMFKQMYISYVANCKFTSINTLPSINFMRSSLVELYLLDTTLAYSVAFPFIRQLAIHLRNALTPNSQGEGKQKKSEVSRVVYSWQFVHSLHLWADVLAQAGNKGDENLKLLIYPVVQICMGTIKLIPTRKYIPLRFQIVRMLTKLQDKTGVFIPVLPLITEVLLLTDFTSKSAKKFSVRPIDLSICLKAEPNETGYLKAVSENAFETLLAYYKVIATDLAFPETVTPTLMNLRTFLKKKCSNAEVSKKFKALIEKIDANSKYISDKRNKALEDGTVTLADKKSHQILQIQMQTNKPHPPILTYAADYFKVNQKLQLKSQKPAMETKEEKRIPKPSALKNKASGSIENAFDKPMFKSDSEDDSDADLATKLDDTPAPESTKLKQKKKRKLQPKESPDEKPRKKKIKKGKSKKVKITPDDDDMQDELVDFELSD